MIPNPGARIPANGVQPTIVLGASVDAQLGLVKATTSTGITKAQQAAENAAQTARNTDAASQARDQALAAEIAAMEGMTYVGPWDPEATYRINDVVTHGGDSWARLTAGSDGEPGDPQHWGLVARKGDGAGFGDLIETDVTGLYESQTPPIPSAYDVAVQQGYAGTVEQWLAEQKGETGDRGPEGPYGGTEVVDPQMRSMLADETLSTGRYAQVALRRGVDAREFGVIGDDTTDGAAALEIALASIADGGTLHITVPIRVTREVVASLPGSNEKRIVFSDRGRIRADFDTRGKAILRFADSENVRIEAPVLVGSGPGASQSTAGIYGLSVSTSTNISVRGGSITNTHREGISCTDVAGLSISGVYLADLNFSLQMGAIQMIRTQDTTVTGCEVTRSGWKGISASTCDRISITDCNIHDIYGGDGILLGGCTDLRIVSNTVSGIGAEWVSKAGDGIKVTEATDGDGKASEHGVVASNTVRNVSKGGGGIRITASKHLLLTGNEIDSVDNNAIPIASSVSLEIPIHATDILVTGNKVRNTPTHAIYVGAGSERVTIGGNVIDQVSSGSGILIAGGTEIVTTNNYVTRAGVNAVRYLTADITGYAVGNITPGSITSTGQLVTAGPAISNVQEVTTVRPLVQPDQGAVLILRTAGTYALPEGTGLDTGWNVYVKNVSAGVVTIQRSGINTIDAKASIDIPSYGAAQIVRRNASTFVTV